MSYLFKKGATSQSIELYIIDSTAGTPETGVLWNTAGIDLKYRRKDAAAVSITEAALTTPALTDTWETGGFLEIGNGVYRLDLPDAALASAAGIDRVVVFGTVTGMVVLPVTIHLTDIDLNTALASSTIGTCTTNTDLVTAAAVKTAIEAGGSSLAQILADTGTTLENRLIAIEADTDVIDDGTSGLVKIAQDVAATLVDTTGLNGDAMRGTNSAALASVCTEARLATLTDWINGGRLDLILDIIASDTTTDIPGLLATIAGYIDTEVAAIVTALGVAQADLDKLTGADGATLATLQGLYAPNKVVPDAAGTAPTAAEIKTALEADGSKLDHLWEMTENDAGTRRLTENALEQGPSGGASAAEIKTAMEVDGGKLDHLWEMTEDDGGTRRLTENAVEQAPSGAGLTDTQNTALILIRDIIEGDAKIDITTTPWQLVITKKGTATEVVKKDLKDVAGVNLAAITTVIGQQVEP